MIKNILVTGGTGYIGSHLCIKLLQEGYNITILDSFINSKKKTLKKIKNISNKSFFFFEIDILDIKKVSTILKKKKIDLVIHLAALKKVNESIKHPDRYYKNNILGITNLLEAMNNANIKKFIFSSSAVVYGKSKYLPIDEKHTTEPLSPYGLTKLFGEKLLDYISTTDRKWKIISLRYFNPVGSHNSGKIGDNSNKPDNIMPVINNVALKKKKYFEIFGTNYNSKDGTAIRDYIHVMDVVDAHIVSLKKLDKFSGHNIFNIGTGKGVSIKELLKTYQSVNNLKLNVNNAHKRKGDIPISFAKVNKIKDKLGWKAKYNLKDMCSSSYNFAKKLTTK
jgi:UDP-glucose 4-epimerase